MRKKSVESDKQLVLLKDSIMSKWNKEYVTNLLEKDNLKNCNVGTTFLTSPMNFAKSPSIIKHMQNSKEFLLSNIDEYAKKLEPEKDLP